MRGAVQPSVHVEVSLENSLLEMIRDMAESENMESTAKDLMTHPVKS